jgi:16S rRNA G966 N2-methylase RsmD
LLADTIDFSKLSFDEDWQLSQFWYDDHTAEELARECVRLCQDDEEGRDTVKDKNDKEEDKKEQKMPKRIACISCPTLYIALKKLFPDSDVKSRFSQDKKRKKGFPLNLFLFFFSVSLFEFDKRFQKFGSDFVFYDYKSPLDIPRELYEQFDVVFADPPFLSEECLTKTAVTMKFLAKKKIILCTGNNNQTLNTQNFPETASDRKLFSFQELSWSSWLSGCWI